MTEHIESAYLAVKTESAQKLGRNGGGITYKVLTDSDRQHLFQPWLVKRYLFRSSSGSCNLVWCTSG